MEDKFDEERIEKDIEAIRMIFSEPVVSWYLEWVKEYKENLGNPKDMVKREQSPELKTACDAIDNAFNNHIKFWNIATALLGECNVDRGELKAGRCFRCNFHDEKMVPIDLAFFFDEMKNNDTSMFPGYPLTKKLDLVVLYCAGCKKLYATEHQKEEMKASGYFLRGQC